MLTVPAMTTPRRRIVAGALSLSFLVAACGSDSDTSTPADAPAQNTTANETGDSPSTDAPDTDAPAVDVEISGTLVGVGASAQNAAMAGWQAGFQALHPDATIEYDPVGSGGGRRALLEGGADFAGSDSALSDEEYEESKQACAGDLGAINLPHYISPIAIAYNLPGVDGLRLSPAVLAGIFANEITNWDDPAIVADNPDADLPSSRINPVHRSDDSGTTKNFTDYLTAVAPDIWTWGAIESWDGEGPGGGEGAPQTQGVVQAVGAGAGSIGYADASQVASLQTALIGVGDDFVAYSPEAAARVIDVSERVAGRGEHDFSFKLARDTTEEGVYPIVLVSYHIICLQYDNQDTADFVTTFFSYVSSADGQAAAAAAAGSAPLTPELSAQIAQALAEISVV